MAFPFAAPMNLEEVVSLIEELHARHIADDVRFIRQLQQGYFTRPAHELTERKETEHAEGIRESQVTRVDQNPLGIVGAGKLVEHGVERILIE